MFVVMAHTRGDELIGSEAKPLFAHADRAICEAKMADFIKDRDQWLGVHEVPTWAHAGIFSRFDIVETPF